MDINTIIPSGTRFTAGDNVFFALKKPLVINAGRTTGTAVATCLTAGSIGNGYTIGQIKTLVDPVPYVANVKNTTKSEGGSDRQDDDSYREVIHTAPERFSVAGPDGAYIYHAKRASAKIIDVTVWSPTAGTVEVRPLLEGGQIPEEEMLKTVKATLSNRTVRPLTDKVDVLAPESVSYDIDMTYYIDRGNETQTNAIKTAVERAVNDYKLWQKSKLGRDINPSELIARVVNAGAKRVTVLKPEYKQVQNTQVAVCGNASVKMGGVEDE